jgi:hypothetical protein
VFEWRASSGGSPLKLCFFLAYAHFFCVTHQHAATYLRKKETHVLKNKLLWLKQKQRTEGLEVVAYALAEATPCGRVEGRFQVVMLS